MRWVTGWHVGQLVMAWVAAIFLMSLLLVGGIVVSGSASSIDYRRERFVRDSVARLPANSHVIADSLNALRRAGASDSEIELYLNSVGLVDTSFVPPNRSELRWAAVYRFLTITMLIVAGALPVLMFVATWMWFGAKRLRPMPQ